MPKANKQIEIQLEKALDSLANQSKPNITKTAREFALKRFLKRYPEYYIRRRKALDIERALALDKSVVERWFQDYEHIYNFDETSFQIGIGKDQFIITRYPKKKLFNSSIINRESITILEAISTISRILGTKRLVLYDRFGLYIIRQFVEFCEKNNIILFFLLLYTSYILQPLDIGVFSVYKHYHSKAVEAATMSRYRKFSKDKFLYSIGEIRRKTFKLYTIKLGFKLIGLWPINSKLITDELDSYDPYHNNIPRPDIPSTIS
ncbi:hypothetical protein N7527_003811 [Penicillium freii]|nr:hypothetical protein N7527_003811 [Penicillium freii]